MQSGARLEKILSLVSLHVLSGLLGGLMGARRYVSVLKTSLFFLTSSLFPLFLCFFSSFLFSSFFLPFCIVDIFFTRPLVFCLSDAFCVIRFLWAAACVDFFFLSQHFLLIPIAAKSVEGFLVVVVIFFLSFFPLFFYCICWCLLL